MTRQSRVLMILLMMLSGFYLPLAKAADSGALDLRSVEFKTAQGALMFSQYQGQVIYLDFWASWCGPCRKSFPWLNTMQKKYAAMGFKVIAVNLDKDSTLAQKFLNEYPANFSIAYDPQGQLASRLKVVGMPSSFLIDRKGNIVSSHVGFRENEIDAMESKIKNLLAN